MVKQISTKSMQSSLNHHQLKSYHDKQYHRIDSALHHTNPYKVMHKSNSSKISKSPLGKIFNRFIQSIAQVNDSGTFDVSLEIKTIQTNNSTSSQANAKGNPNIMRHIRHELDMKNEAVYENLTSTPKSSSSPYLYRKAKKVYQNFILNNNGNTNSTNSSREASPRLNKTDDNIILKYDKNEENNGGFQRTQSQRSSSRSAKLLQFFSCKKQQENTKDNTSSSSHSNSPIFMRSQTTQNNTVDHEESRTTRNLNSSFSPNSDNSSFKESSFEMQSPLLPTFKITPVKVQESRTRYNTSDFTHFIRSSFYAKRAYVTRLRRSLSEQEYLHNNREQAVQLNFLPHSKNEKHYNNNNCDQRRALANVTNCVNDRTTILRKSDSSGNISPIYRVVQVQSSRSLTSMTTAVTPAITAKTTSSTINKNNVTINNLLDNCRKTDYQMERSRSIIRPSKCDTNAVLSWAVSLECLLEDIAGLKAFTKFLKLEYSAENIYFWVACERLRFEDDDVERSAQAKEIYKKHLANGASEAVNVDSKARDFNEMQLGQAPRDIFMHAQKQIFNLMKFDSYPRFLRSDLYKNCLQAAERGHQIPGSDDDSLDHLLNINGHNITNASTKLKKSVSNAEDRRRKSLLPWHRKTRSKSRERIENTKGTETAKVETNIHLLPSKIPIIAGSSVKTLTNQRHNSVSTVYDSRTSLSSSDVLPIISLDAACSLCRIKFTDGATTMVQTKPSETIGQLVERLLEKRGIRYRSFEAIVKENNKAIDLNTSTQEIAGKEVEIEQRVGFKIHLPDPKVISVKSKPKKYLFEVVKPILSKYNYDMKMVDVLYKDTQMKVDLLQPVTVVDGQRLQIALRNILIEDYQNDGISKKFKTSEALKILPYPAAAISQQAAMTVAARKTVSHSLVSSFSSSDLIIGGSSNEICPKFSETDGSSKSDDCDSESSSVFEKTINTQDCSSNNNKISGAIIKSKSQQYSINGTLVDEQTKQLQQQELTSGITSSIFDAKAKQQKKPLIAKLKAGVKVQVTERLTEGQDVALAEVTKKAPLARMEDQRISDVKTDSNNSVESNIRNDNMSECLRKARNNLLPINKRCSGTTLVTIISTNTKIGSLDRNKPKPNNKIIVRTCSNTDNEIMMGNEFKNPPPPLPPKPKVLPIKPSNWGINTNPTFSKITTTLNTTTTPTTLN